MTGIIDDIKEMYNRPNNGLIKIIMINIAFFLIINLVMVFCKLFGFNDIASLFYLNFKMPADINKFIYRPWTLFTYFFSHKDFLHIIFNLLFLYWFGRIIEDLVGNSKVIAIYLLGGLMGAGVYFLFYYTIPYFIQYRSVAEVLGASGSVYAIVVGAATLRPDYELRLLLLGNIKIKWIAAVYILISFIGIGGSNAGGHAVHLGGALLGFLFVKRLQAGDDWSRFVMPPITWIGNLFAAQPKIRVTHRSKNQYKTGGNSAFHQNANSRTSQNDIDNILDKISQSGYESLTKEEKQMLWEASKRNNG